MKKYFNRILHKFFLIERNPRTLARTTALGVFIALSPFIGLQTFIVFLCAWLFRLPALILFTIVYLINNPFLTMIPIAIADYATGYILFTYIIPWDACSYNPSWFEWVAQKIAPYITYYLGVTQVCFWYFVVGGLVFAILVSVPLYPLFYYCYKKLEKNHPS